MILQHKSVEICINLINTAINEDEEHLSFSSFFLYLFLFRLRYVYLNFQRGQMVAVSLNCGKRDLVNDNDARD